MQYMRTLFFLILEIIFDEKIETTSMHRYASYVFISLNYLQDGDVSQDGFFSLSNTY